MGSYIGTFKRTEKKYRLAAQQRDIVRAAVSAQMVSDAYGRHRVNSLYFDTDDRSLIARSLEKPLYKEKLRLRWYGTASAEGPVFVEIKKKLAGVVYKRRVAMSARGAVAYLLGEPFLVAARRFPLVQEGVAVEPSFVDRQIAREIDALRKRRSPLRPSALISCVRTAWAMPSAAGGGAGASNTAGIEGYAGTVGSAAGAADTAGGALTVACPTDELRLTIDDNLAFADLLPLPAADALRIATGQQQMPLLALVPDSILEVKAIAPYPRWLVQALNQARAYPQSFSKYGAMSMLVHGQAAEARAAVPAAAPASVPTSAASSAFTLPTFASSSLALVQ